MDEDTDTVESWRKLYEEIKAELDEFKETSQEYEKELETELGRSCSVRVDAYVF